MTTLGIISDTHGLLRPQALQALQGCEKILHAGDVGKAAILEELQKIAPVVAVRGNVDHDAWADALPETAVVEAGGELIYMIHDLSELDLHPAAAGIRVVVSGHSHRASQVWRGNLLYLNPGSAGPRRFALPVSLARLNIGEGKVEVEMIELEMEGSV